jgi:cytoskeletal protein RodZ
VTAATIGEQLRLAREGRGIPLREISEQTRISIHYLEAIETNDYKRLPGGIFNRSFVKAYARYVGYDEKDAIDGYTRYMREQGVASDEVSTTPFHSKVYTEAPATRSPILTVVLAIVILAVLTAVALTLLHWAQRRSANLRYEVPLALLRSDNPWSPTRQPNGVGGNATRFAADLNVVSLNNWKADYVQFLLQ